MGDKGSYILVPTSERPRPQRPPCQASRLAKSWDRRYHACQELGQTLGLRFKASKAQLPGEDHNPCS